MPVSIPVLEDYDVSSTNGFLPSKPPIDVLPNEYYEAWEHIVQNLQGLIMSKRLREVVNKLPVLSTVHLSSEAEWRRAYSVLGFITHAYIWGGNKPAERVPPPLSIPFLATCKHLELPSVATYAGVVLWNWKPLFSTERSDTLANLDMMNTFTGSMDEKWFYLISVAIEARGGPLIPLMLQAVEAARHGKADLVTEALQTFAERLDELGILLTKMYDNCDPRVFYNRIRPYLAGSKNMAEAGLPNGVIFDDGGPMNKQKYVQYSGGSNAQSSIIQFFDAVLSVEHRPTGEKKEDGMTTKKKAPPLNFIHDMRRYMPGRHARFLQHVAKIANIRAFVEDNPHNRPLTLAYDAALAMISALRDKHIQIVSRYIIIQARQAANATHPAGEKKINLATRPKSTSSGEEGHQEKKKLVGTGGSSLISFLRQARDETGEPAVADWARKLLSREKGPAGVRLGQIEKQSESVTECKGLSVVWTAEDDSGGLCFH